MEEESNSNTLSGTPVTQTVGTETVFVNAGPLIPVKKNEAAQIIGWLVVAMGGLQILNGLGSLTDFGMTDFEGNPITTSASYKAVTILTAIATATLYGLGGYKMTQYQKQGIWLALLGIVVAYIGGVVSSMMLGETMMEGSGALVGGLQGICGLFCSMICGLIVLIPLLLSDGGME